MTRSTIENARRMGADRFAESNRDSLVEILRWFGTAAERDAFVAGYIAAREADLRLQLMLGTGDNDAK